jgi:hypothetical protein
MRLPKPTSVLRDSIVYIFFSLTTVSTHYASNGYLVKRNIVEPVITDFARLVSVCGGIKMGATTGLHCG